LNNLQIREVNFNGDKLLAAQDDTGKIYVGVKYICQGLGLNERKQRDRLKTHEVFSKGCTTWALPSTGGTQDTVVIDIEYMPLWLASINPKLVRQEIKGKLVEYQLKAKDVLASAFLPPSIAPQVSSSIPQLPQTYQEALRMLADTLDENERLLPKAIQYDTFLDSKGYHDMGSVAKTLGTGRTRLFQLLREHKVLMGNNVPYQKYINQGYFVVKQEVFGSFINTKTYVTAKGISFIYLEITPLDSIEKVHRFLQLKAQ
jgi:phage antirepressor YoqD-like protein